jgi:1,4-alpha-glucan branching enzyme
VPKLSSSDGRGALAIVLHTHMPYVEGFGTWPFGEEWLWEAIVGCYLPMLDLLDEGGALTLSLTPVLCDQLEAPGLAERFERFAGELRRMTHEEDAEGLRAGGHELLAREVERAWGDYEDALERFRGRRGDLLGALAPHVQWTSSATHAILPLLATEAGARLQVRTGVEAFQRRFGAGWRGGFWLPECAYEPWLRRSLLDAGVHAVCVELTGHFGLGAGEHLHPLLDESGLVLVPIDRSTMELVWSDRGYPAGGAYRDYHHHTLRHHNPWDNDGNAYDRDRALALARAHAADFVARTIARLDGERREGSGGLVVCALDTELLGHWWYEGVDWLRAVVAECARQGLELIRLDDALARSEPRMLSGSDGWAASSWGSRGDLSTWSGPAVAEMAFATRAAELSVLASGSRAGAAATRELLALQASDWAFMVSRDLAGPYPLERFKAHHARLLHALAEGANADTGALRNLAVDADPASLLLIG